MGCKKACLHAPFAFVVDLQLPSAWTAVRKGKLRHTSSMFSFT